MPFFLGLLFVLFLYLKKSLSKKKLVGNYIRAISISIFIFQPSIFTNLGNIINCQSFYPYPGKSFIKKAIAEECFTNLYFTWTISLVLPSFLFYGIIEPTITLVYLLKHRAELNNTSFLLEISFLIQGFDKSKFYW